MNINAINAYAINAYATECIYHYCTGIYMCSSRMHGVYAGQANTLIECHTVGKTAIVNTTILQAT